MDRRLTDAPANIALAERFPFKKRIPQNRIENSMWRLKRADGWHVVEATRWEIDHHPG